MGIASSDDNRVDVCFLTKSLLVQESVRVICKTQGSISLVVIHEALGWLRWSGQEADTDLRQFNEGHRDQK